MKPILLILAISAYSFCSYCGEIIGGGSVNSKFGSISLDYTRSMLNNSCEWNPPESLPFKIADAITQARKDLKELNLKDTKSYKLSNITFSRHLKTNKWTYMIRLMKGRTYYDVALPYCLTKTPQKHYGKINSLDINVFNNLDSKTEEEKDSLEKEAMRKSQNYAYVQGGHETIGIDKFKYDYELHMHEKELFESPSWNPDKEDIPLSIGKAYKASLKDISNKMPDTHGFIIRNLSIVRFSNTDKWFYLFSYGNYETRDSISSFVLFSGEVLQPDKVFKEGEKEILQSKSSTADKEEDGK
jgi:hypothetical protein